VATIRLPRHPIFGFISDHFDGAVAGARTGAPAAGTGAEAAAAAAATRAAAAALFRVVFHAPTPREFSFLNLLSTC